MRLTFFITILFVFIMTAFSYANDSAKLIESAARGDIQSVKALLEKKADVNAKSNNGITALIMASQNGHTEIAKTLLEKGAEVNARANNGFTALMIASEGGHTDTVKVLLEKRQM